MQWYEWTAAATFTLAATTAGWMALSPPKAEAPHGSAGQAGPALSVQSATALLGAEVRPTDGTGEAGHIHFEVEPPLRVVGVTTAIALRIVDGRPRLADARPLHALQMPDGTLNVRSWLRSARPVGPYALRFALRCVGRPGVEHRLGYAVFNPADLATGGLTVRPPRQVAARMVAKTLDGVALPGAVVVVAPMSLPMSALAAVLVTGEDGTATVSGLDPDREWTASLPEGIGPDRAPVEATLPTDGRFAPLVVQLRGAWTFERLRVDRALEGMSEVVEELSSPSSQLPTIWPVTMCALAGSGSGSAIVMMRRPDVPVPADLAIRFKGRAPIPLQRTGDGSFVLGLGAAASTPSSAVPPPDAASVPPIPSLHRSVERK